MKVRKFANVVMLGTALMVGGCKKAANEAANLPKNVTIVLRDTTTNPAKTLNIKNYKVDEKDTIFITNGKISVSKNAAKTTADTLPPKINWFQAITGFMSKEKVAQINKSRRVPNNCKFIKSDGDYDLDYNFFGFRKGTQILPQGYEAKRNIIGQVTIVREGTTGFTLKNE